jgi:hypothetical protein
MRSVRDRVKLLDDKGVSPYVFLVFPPVDFHVGHHAEQAVRHQVRRLVHMDLVEKMVQ